MVRYIIIISTLLIAIALGFLVTLSYNKKVKDSKEIQKLPDFSFLRIQSLDTFTRDDLNTTYNQYLILYFNSQCEYCKYDVENVLKNPQIFKETQILLVSGEEIDAIKKAYDVNRLPNIELYHCPDATFFKTFKSNITPSMFIYNKDKILLKKFIGETSIHLVDSILNYR